MIYPDANSGSPLLGQILQSMLAGGNEAAGSGAAAPFRCGPRHLAVTVALGLAATGLILLQASLLAHVLAAAATGTGITVLAGTLGALAAVLAARACRA